MGGLTGKVALITGASRGIGLAVAQHFAGAGASLAICGRTASDLESATGELTARGAVVSAHICDVSQPQQCREFVAAAQARLGSIDILVNNAAYMMKPEPLETFDEGVYERCIATSLNSVFYMMRFCFQSLKQRHGKIINFASFAGLRGHRRLAGYAAAKMGIIGLTRVAAAEWAEHHINVNCIAPIAMSDAWEGVMQALPPGSDPFEAIGLRRNTLGYAGNPLRDIAPAVEFLCSEASRFITGHVLPVDGGLLELE
jgi:NAD(P)-dependent dehydrogenase (short-subunit alcohol dehydrogenase family)